MRGVLVILLAGLACSTQGGTITSGSFSLSGQNAFASVSGENFAATVHDADVGPFQYNGFPPFQPLGLEFSWSGICCLSGVLYNGMFYQAPTIIGLPLGVPFSFVSFGASLISSPPIITGPGTYDLDYSVTLSFTLFDSSHTVFYSETDTGFATGSINYTAGGGGTTFVFGHGVQATIVPEPSSWSSIALAACCLGAFAGIRLRHQLPGHRFQEQ